MRVFVRVSLLHLLLAKFSIHSNVYIDGFSVSQLYAIIVLPNGGPDLETFTFTPSNKNSWSQACSIFWQVVRALAEAEDMVHFEVCPHSILTALLHKPES